MATLAFSHPELKKRYNLLVEQCWKRAWDISISSSSRGYDTQKEWYRLYKAGLWPTGPVANPDQDWGPTPWGWHAKGSLHMAQQDGYTHALDLNYAGCTAAQFHALARTCGIQFPEAGEDWHAQWWGNNGIFPITLQEDDDMPSGKEIADALMDELIPVHDYSTGKDIRVPLRQAIGWMHSEFSLLRHHVTGEPIVTEGDQ